MDSLKEPLLLDSNRLSSDDSGSDNGSGDDALSFHTATSSVESDQPPVAAAEAPLVAAAPPAPAQRQVPPFDDISARIGMLNEMEPGEMARSQIIQLLFGIFSRIALALENRTLTEREANTLYKLITRINIGNVRRVNHLKVRQVEIIADIFKESSEGTARDIDLLTVMLIPGVHQVPQQVLQQVIDGIESTTLPLDRIFDSEKAVAAMMRFCNLGVQTNKCAEFNNRLAAGLLQTGQPINMGSVTRMSQQPINLDKFTNDDFSFIINEINRDAAERQVDENNVWKARSMFHKGGRGNMQKKKSQSKKYKPKNTRKSKYNKYKCSKKNKKT